MIFDAGLPGASERLMSAVKGGTFLDFPGIVRNDEKAFEFARRQIDSLEKKNLTDFTDGEKQI